MYVAGRVCAQYLDQIVVLEVLCTVIGADRCSGGVHKLLQLLCTTPQVQQAASMTVQNTSRTTSCSSYCAQYLPKKSCSNYCAQHPKYNKLLQLLYTTPQVQQAASKTVHNTSRTISSSYCAQYLPNKKLLQLLCTTSPEQQGAPITVHTAHEQKAAPITVHNISRTTSYSNYCAQHPKYNKLLQ